MRLRSMCTVALLLLAANAFAAIGDDAVVEPDAKAAIQRMSDFLSGQRSFSVKTNSTLERLDPSGEDQTFDGDGLLVVQRPNKLLFQRTDGLDGPRMFYDGRHVTLAGKAPHDVSLPVAPATLDGMLQLARERMGISPPGAVLLGSDPYSTLMEGTQSGKYVGTVELDGLVVQHYAFVAEDRDWQIWIQAGDEPLPKKLVVGYKDPYASPVNTLVFSDWELNPTLEPDAFDARP